MSEYPALNNEPVTERHTRICRENGHATHTVNGVDTGICPRCGEVKETERHSICPRCNRVKGYDGHPYGECDARIFKPREIVRIRSGFRAGQTGWIKTVNGDGTYYVYCVGGEFLYDGLELQGFHENNGD